MVYRIITRKEILIDIDDELPVGLENELSEEQCDAIWEAIENNMIQSNEYLEEVE